MISDNSVKIIQDICQFMADGGGDCAQWLVGSAADVDKVLFLDHGIPRDYRWHICRRAQSAEEARAIVQGFRNLSCEECPGSHNGAESVYVYAYLKRPRTGLDAISGIPLHSGA
jgi:hypothetical protein